LPRAWSAWARRVASERRSFKEGGSMDRSTGMTAGSGTTSLASPSTCRRWEVLRDSGGTSILASERTCAWQARRDPWRRSSSPRVSSSFSVSGDSLPIATRTRQPEQDPTPPHIDTIWIPAARAALSRSKPATTSTRRPTGSKSIETVAWPVASVSGIAVSVAAKLAQETVVAGHVRLYHPRRYPEFEQERLPGKCRLRRDRARIGLLCIAMVQGSRLPSSDATRS